MPVIKERYPPNWKQIATAVKQAADWTCQKCGRVCIKPDEQPSDFAARLCDSVAWHDYLEAPTRYLLTTSHRDQDPRNNQPSNLWALCPGCHLNYDRAYRERQRLLRQQWHGQLTLPIENPATVKMASLWQPWASLVAYGAKRYETRSWSIRYRGPIAIHATLRKPIRADLEMMADALQLHPVLAAQAELLMQSIPRQAVVAIAKLTDCMLITPELAAQQTPLERMVGDWTPGRYAWQLDHITPIYDPIPIAGHQGLRDRTLPGSQHLDYALSVAA